jgi:hypothetical protein
MRHGEMGLQPGPQGKHSENRRPAASRGSICMLKAVRIRRLIRFLKYV